MVFTQDKRIVIEIEVFQQSQRTEEDYLVTLLRQRYTLVGVLNFYEQPDIRHYGKK